MKFKKWFMCAVALMMALSMFGCGGGDDAMKNIKPPVYDKNGEFWLGGWDSPINTLEDYKLADEAFGRLLRQYPEFVQMDEVLYNMFLMYSLWGKPAEANTYKMQLIEGYPGSRYAMTLSDPDFEYNARYGKHLEDSLYAETYNAFKAGNITAADIQNFTYLLLCHRFVFSQTVS